MMQLGDKVRIRAGEYGGHRGVVRQMQRGRIGVAIDACIYLIWLTEPEVTNLSLAARRAWSTTPKRAVGRPRIRGTSRTGVLVRLDTDLLAELKEAEREGLIADRVAFINAALRVALGCARRDQGLISIVT